MSGTIRKINVTMTVNDDAPLEEEVIVTIIRNVIHDALEDWWTDRDSDGFFAPQLLMIFPEVT